MVFVLVALTVLLIILSEVIGRREEQKFKTRKKISKSGIFIEPVKTIHAVGEKEKRLYHPSHTWVAPVGKKSYYIGYDNFIPEIFTRDVYLSGLPERGTELHQGDRTWEVGISDKKVAQYAPVSGKVTEINSAVLSEKALPSGELEKSWILKIEANDLEKERHNLVPHNQAMHINRMLSDELKWTAMHGHYLNDGGELDENFIIRMSHDKWKNIIEKFFQ